MKPPRASKGKAGTAGARSAPSSVARWRGHGRVSRSPWAGCLLACVLILIVEDAFAQMPGGASDAEACLTANRSLSLGAPLPRTTARLNAGEPVRIIAVGSSSTTGLWVLSPSATYPEVMRRELARLRPNARVEVINSGRIGDTVGGSIARFERDVVALRPDLVVWQLGTNDVAWGGRADGLRDRVVEGVRILKASGADVILMDLQYAPLVLASSQHVVMEAIIAEVARQERVGLFPRFALMRRSIDAGLSSSALVAWDGLHNSVAGYDCVGRALARAVHAGGR
jgi:acyl-CoA thioesterase I